ncbi:MAG TPA: serine protease [Ilumatobacter sp.]
MKRTRWIAVVCAVALAACAPDTPAGVTTVEIAATPCDRPSARLGVGTIVGEGLVLTAAHVVEDGLRDLSVDGRPARVIGLDARIDTALLAADTPSFAEAPSMATETTESVRILTPTDVIDTTVTRVVTLTVDDATDRTAHRRQALVLEGAVVSGTSGAPVVDDDDRIVGMVTIAHRGRDVTYATRTAELRTLIDPASPSGRETVTGAGLAAPQPCA